MNIVDNEVLVKIAEALKFVNMIDNGVNAKIAEALKSVNITEYDTNAKIVEALKSVNMTNYVIIVGNVTPNLTISAFDDITTVLGV
uniref:Uncharacterized protein n=1 Tax=Pithovirus LCPAC404 TaxID=2506597 RepID=A0A481ZG53_9VIRU|nr:MAG: hypothetical protein LCPAC404_00850 [Pithovirus LCPAC404]